MTAKLTQMFREAAAAPGLVRAQLEQNAPLTRVLAERLKAAPPRAVTTLGRGSSDNVATFARYLIETRLGVMTASSSPSVSSVYEAAPDMSETLCLAVSQSGRSPDLLAAAQAAAAAGATVVALVNAAESPLSALAHVTIPLRAGPELSVAATKSFIAGLVAVAQLVAEWGDDAGLAQALDELPARLEAAWSLDWSAAIGPLAKAEHLYVVARGVGFAIAQEAALKFKETCGLHAEAFSTAEIRHGPMALIGPSFPVLAFTQGDETEEGVEALVAVARGQGAAVIQVGGSPAHAVMGLPSIAGHPALEPISQIQSFYRLADGLARTRGFDPDRPSHLAKVTETI
ncbi:MAG TPA: SIS domain-containing protein [Caulobacteraceae bacterium]|jgi:glucosamine--fructose-6-phosphate aminotransferase (isomerizing)|nr:SIS domain-containing protein [Caulobacteraceae bacterium]